MNLASYILQKTNGSTYLFSTGQAGYVIKSSSGQLLAIDLYLSNCVERTEGHIGFKRMLPQLLGADELEFDVIVATHPHLDHFDIDAIPEMMSTGNPQLCCSVNCKELIEQTQMEYFNDRIRYVKPGDDFVCGDFAIHFVGCDHGEGAPDAVGVVVEVDGKVIYEAGDTCLRLDRVDEVTRFGAIDVLIAPINGAYGNLNEKECVELGKAINPRITIPCHYGMFASHGGNPGLFYEEAKSNHLTCAIMAQGESLEL